MRQPAQKTRLRGRTRLAGRFTWPAAARCGGFVGGPECAPPGHGMRRAAQNGNASMSAPHTRDKEPLDAKALGGGIRKIGGERTREQGGGRSPVCSMPAAPWRPNAASGNTHLPALELRSGRRRQQHPQCPTAMAAAGAPPREWGTHGAPATTMAATASRSIARRITAGSSANPATASLDCLRPRVGRKKAKDCQLRSTFAPC